MPCARVTGSMTRRLATLKQGFEVADQRSDKMPRDEMGRMLVVLGEAVPESKREARPLRTTGTGSGFQCQRPMCVAGGHAHQLDGPPMKDEFGQHIYQAICAGLLERLETQLQHQGHQRAAARPEHRSRSSRV